MKKLFYIRLTNSYEESIDFIVEPWGDLFCMKPHETFEVAFEPSLESGASAPEIVWGAHSVTIFAGDQSTFEVSVDGHPLADENRPHDGLKAASAHQINGITSRY